MPNFLKSINSHWGHLHHVQAPDLVKASLNDLPWWQGGIRVTNEKGMPLFFVYAKVCIYQLTCPPGTVAGLLGHVSVSARHSCRHATVARVTNSWMVNFKTSAVPATKPLVARRNDLFCRTSYHAPRRPGSQKSNISIIEVPFSSEDRRRCTWYRFE